MGLTPREETTKPTAERSMPRELDPGLPVEKLPYSNYIKILALKVLQIHGDQIARDNPILADATILKFAPYLQQTQELDKVHATAISPGPIDDEKNNKLFDIAWGEYLKLAHMEPGSIPNFLNANVKIIRTYIAKVKAKASRQFEETFLTDREKSLNYLKKNVSGVPEEDTILGEKGIYWQQVDWKNTENDEVLRAHNIQLALASALVHTLRNQRNVAGHLDGKYHELPKGYQSKCNEYFTKIKGNPPKLKFTGWDALFSDNPKLRDELNEKFSIVDEFSESDCNDQFGFFPSGQAIPSVHHPDLVNKGIKALTTRAFHPNGRQYADINIVDAISLPPGNFAKYISSDPNDETSILDWQDLASLKELPDAKRWIPFSISIGLPRTNSPQLLELNHVTHSLALTTDPISGVDHLKWKSGHFRIDGSAQDEPLKMFTNYLDKNELRPTRDFFENIDLPKLDVELLKKAKSTQEILNLLGLRDVIIGHIFDNQALSRAKVKFNELHVLPKFNAIENYFQTSEPIKKTMLQLFHTHGTILEEKYPKEHDGVYGSTKVSSSETSDMGQRIIDDIYLQMNILLNPATATVDALAMASEDTAHTTTCAATLSPFRRLATYICDKADKDYRTITESFHLTANQRIISKLGLGIQSFISVGLANVANFARKLSGPLSPELKNKVLSAVQISDLGPHKNFFITASSAIIPELGEVIGVAGEYISGRLDLRKENIVNKIRPETAFSDEEMELLPNLFPPGDNRLSTNSHIFRMSILNAKIKNNQKNINNPLELFKFIINQEKTIANPEQLIAEWLIAKSYIDLVNIPKKATNYLLEACNEPPQVALKNPEYT